MRERTTDRPAAVEAPEGLERYGRAEPTRDEQRRRWGSALVVVGLLWLVFELMSQGSLLGVRLGLFASSAPVDTQVYSYDAERVRVSGLSDNVTVIAWDEPGIRVEGTRHAYGWLPGAAGAALDQIDIETSVQGDTLLVNVRRPLSLFSLGGAPYVDLVIRLPEGAGLEVSTVSGELRIEGAEASGALVTTSGDISVQSAAGDLTVTTTSGSIEVSDHTGELTAAAMSGDISVEGGALTGLQARAVSGDLSVEAVGGPLQLNTISGEISVLDSPGAEVRAESTSGDITVEGRLSPGGSNELSSISGDVYIGLAEDPGLRLDVQTLGGDIEADLELQGATQDRRRLAGATGDGATGLRVSTSSGDVAIELE